MMKTKLRRTMGKSPDDIKKKGRNVEGWKENGEKTGVGKAKR
jgi:hypothetical protein